MLHKQFNRDSRIELAILLKSGKKKKECAKILGIERSNVSKEIIRNRDLDGIYRGWSAHQRCLQRRKGAKKKYRKIENDTKLQKHVIGRIKKFWSPEQIAGRLRKETGKIVCHETIYQFIYRKKPELTKFLRHKNSKHRRKRGTNARMSLNRASKIKLIDERPREVGERKRIGDWEDDTIIGKEKNQRIWTCVERKSGLGIAEKLDFVFSDFLFQKILTKFKSIPKEKRLTLTRDNGPEFGDHDRFLERNTGMQVYRAHPYHSWERGSNENWNGLLRQFFPKGIPFANITQIEVEKIVKLLNNRPRKRLGYATPREVFSEGGDSR